MSQVTDYTVPESPLSMSGLKVALEVIFAALGSVNRGGAPPLNPFPGMLWLDSSGDPVELLKVYARAAEWITVLSLNNLSGVLIPYRSGTPLGTMATAAATDYVTKALYNAQTILAAVDDDLPGPVTIAENRIVGRKTSGNVAALTLSEVLDFIGSAAQGDILVRGASGWSRLGKGSARQALQMSGDGSVLQYVSPSKTIVIKVASDETILDTGDGALVFPIPASLNGYNLTEAHAMVSVASASGKPTYQIRNVTQAHDMLSTSITIDAGEYTSYTAAVPPVINTSYDDVATGDRIAIDKDAAGVGAKGDTIILGFTLPTA